MNAQCATILLVGIFAYVSAQSTTVPDTTNYETTDVTVNRTEFPINTFFCSNSTDCDEGECCVESYAFRRIWRTCEPFTEEGENCHFQERDSEIFWRTCPCEEGLECQGGWGIGSLRTHSTCQRTPTLTSTSEPIISIGGFGIRK
nr:venom gland protein U13-PHTX-Pmx1a [Physocyclus mexicanus]